METIIKKKVVRKLLKEAGFNLSDKCFEEIEDRITEMLERAATRAKGNGRVTVLERDI